MQSERQGSLSANASCIVDHDAESPSFSLGENDLQMCLFGDGLELLFCRHFPVILTETGSKIGCLGHAEFLVPSPG